MNGARRRAGDSYDQSPALINHERQQMLWPSSSDDSAAMTRLGPTSALTSVMVRSAECKSGGQVSASFSVLKCP